jgi:thioredoxin 1
MSEVILQITKNNFDQETSKGIILIDFFAEWCGPCRMLSPILEDIAREFGDKIKVGKLNIDDDEDIAMRFSVTSVPTMILFKDGREHKRIIGLKDKEALRKFILSVVI